MRSPVYLSTFFSLFFPYQLHLPAHCTATSARFNSLLHSFDFVIQFNTRRFFQLHSIEEEGKKGKLRGRLKHAKSGVRGRSLRRSLWAHWREFFGVPLLALRFEEIKHEKKIFCYFHSQRGILVCKLKQFEDWFLGISNGCCNWWKNFSDFIEFLSLEGDFPNV